MRYVNELESMREYFNTGVTRTYAFRIKQLNTLKKALVQYEHEIYEALHKDLRKNPEECWITENGFLLAEINHATKHLKGWMNRNRVPTNLMNFPSRSYVYTEPLGVVLIIGPWNYPMQLLLSPMIGAISAGNCVVLKPSEFAPATSTIIQKIILENFDPRYILFTEGDGAEVVPSLMAGFTFDHVFFTGSTQTGKLIYQQAAGKLVPVTLELGGKSPCIIEADADLQVAANRIAVTKFSNAGQMCVAPDYILIHESVKEKWVALVKQTLEKFFGKDAQQCRDYGRIINAKQFERLEKLLDGPGIIYGGKKDKADLFIEPSLVQLDNLDNNLMKEEIFGPILPIITFRDRTEVLEIIARHKNPLAFYVFTSSGKKEQEWIEQVQFGGGCCNNASFHLTNFNLPFGGRGCSGIGKYHGKFSFDTFSHKKAWMKTPAWFDPALKYPPFSGKLGLMKKFFG